MRASILWRILPFIFIFAAMSVPLGLLLKKPDSVAPIAGHDHNSSSIPVDLESTDLGGSRHFLLLYMNAPHSFNVYNAFWMRFGTHMRNLDVKKASLTQLETGCGWFAKPQRVKDLEYLKFEKIKDCPFNQDPRFILSVSKTDEKPLSIFSFSARLVHRLTPELFTHKNPDQRKSFVDVKWNLGPNFPDVTPTKTRVELLAYIWQRTPIYFTFVIISLLSAVALAASLFYFFTFMRQSSRPVVILFSGACLFAALSFVYTLWVFPFHGSDEANHFLTFAKLNHRDDLMTAALDLAQRNHFNRILVHIDEHFSHLDIGASARSEWMNTVGPYFLPERSRLMVYIWSFLGLFVQRFNEVGTNIIALRLFNSILFVFAIGGALFVNLKTMKPNRNDVLIFLVFPIIGLLSLSTLPHYANHFSNHAWIIAALVAINLMLLRLLKFDPVPLWWELIFGSVSAIAIMSGRISTPYLVCILLWIATRSAILVLGDDSIQNFGLFVKRGLLHSRLVFISLISVSCGAIFQVGYRGLPILITVPLFAVLFFPFAAALSKVSQFVKRHQPFEKSFERVLIFCGAAYFIGIISFPFFKKLPPLGNIENLPSALPPLTYVRRVLKHFYGSIGLSGDDFLLIRSFLGSFSGPEPTFPMWLAEIAKLPVLLPLALCLMFAAIFGRKVRGQSFLTFVSFLILNLMIASLAYSVAGVQDQFNLHGRYLTGFYVFIATALTVQILLFLGPRTIRNYGIGLFFLGYFLHVGAMSALLLRYF